MSQIAWYEIDGHGTWISKLAKNFHQNLQNSANQFFGKTLLGQDCDITHLEMFFLVAVFLLIVGIIIRRGMKTRDSQVIPPAKFNLYNFVELIIRTFYAFTQDMIGPKARSFFPIIGTAALLIFFSNIMGLIPGFQPPTSNLNVTAACAIVIFLATHYYGFREHGISYVKHFLGPIIKWYALPLMLFLFIIEVISHFVRPFSLAVRLMANMFSDHKVVLVFMGMALGGFLIPIPIMILGVLVCVVQTLVFCLLSIIYFSLAVSHEET